jgi:hypothetical protein
MKPPALYQNHNTVVRVLTLIGGLKSSSPFPAPSLFTPLAKFPPIPARRRRHCVAIASESESASRDPGSSSASSPPLPRARHFPRKACCPSGGLLGGCCFCRTAERGCDGGRRHGGEAFPSAAPGHADRPRAPRRRLRAPARAVRPLRLRQARRGLLPRQARLPPRPRRPFLRFLRLRCTARSSLRCLAFSVSFAFGDVIACFWVPWICGSQVFDGHNGVSAAVFSKEKLLEHVMSAVPRGISREDWLQALPRALVAGFVKTDIDFQRKGEMTLSDPCNAVGTLGKPGLKYA